MNNLHRELAPISDEAWAQIEQEAARTARRCTWSGSPRSRTCKGRAATPWPRSAPAGWRPRTR